MRKLILLALGAAAAWWFLNRDSGQGSVPPPPAPAPEGAPPERVQGTPADSAEAVRDDQPSATGAGDAVVPDTSADDPLVRRQEKAAAAEAAAVGGPADTATADVDEEMRPVIEASGDAEETFEETEDEGR
ncbi:MAG: hypothetical protein JOZ25_12415 [Actinobacteria bacterium]|nr:hypothetical protein [Actinomycetota bacterium]